MLKATIRQKSFENVFSDVLVVTVGKCGSSFSRHVVYSWEAAASKQSIVIVHVKM